MNPYIEMLAKKASQGDEEAKEGGRQYFFQGLDMVWNWIKQMK